MLVNVLWTGVALALVGLMRLGFNAVALHCFGDAASGSANVALSLAVLASLPASTALGGTTVRYLAQARAQGRTAVVGMLYRAFLGASVLLAAATLLAVWLFREQLASTQGLDEGFVAQALWVSFAYVMYLFFRSVLYGLNRVREYTRIELVAGTSFFAALFGLVLLNTPHFLLVAFGAAYSAFSIVAWWKTRGVLQSAKVGGSERPSVREITSYSAIALVGTASSLAVRELAVFLSPQVTDLAGAASLALAFSMLAPLQVLPRMLRTALFAHTAELSGQGRLDELGKSIGEASHWLLLVTLPACGFLLIMGEPLFAMLGGTPTPERLLAFRLLVGAALVDVVATPSANGLAGAGRVWIPNLAAVLALCASSLVWWQFAGEHGLTGLALGMLCNSVIKGGMPIVSAWRRLHAALTRMPARALSLAVLTLLSLAGVVQNQSPYWLAGGYIAACLALLWVPLKELWAQAQLRMAKQAS